jgi:hypothetical protein
LTCRSLARRPRACSPQAIGPDAGWAASWIFGDELISMHKIGNGSYRRFLEKK